MMFYQIFIPTGGGSDAVYSDPAWVQIFFFIAVGAAILGLILFAISAMLDITFDKDSDLLFRFGTCLLIIGIILLSLSIPLLAITGVRVE